MHLLMICSLLWAFAGTDNVIVWQESRSLDWQDFQAQPPEDDPAQAKSYAGLSYKVLDMDDQGATIQVTAVFDPSQSWVREEDKIPTTLQHEQIHFDITEVCARACRKLIAHENFTRENFIERLQEIVQEQFDISNSYQEVYDVQTSMPRDLEKEQEWGRKTKSSLENLKDFREQIVVVRF